ncbi:MAG: terminase [Alphaproteobacteria bacterium]|nr:terminase [Alphaproteobacteria bacterium]MCW5743842.1 terminase [Alphaproteobacteria bacterium]
MPDITFSPPPADPAAADLTRFARDPLEFVRQVFPWASPGSVLAQESGPREWQADILREIGRRLEANANAGVSDAIRVAVASGHGVGKSALMAWIKLWALATFEDAMTVITANTDQQLRTKTWPQVAKWFNLMAGRERFSLGETAIVSRRKGHEKTWRGDRVTWSEHNTEAFAGLHNLRRRIVLLFDEASAIADNVWEVAEGALTDADTEIIWVVFGNPTQSTGRFRECFGRFRNRWITRQIDSRTVPGINQAQLDQWVEDYGEDDDFVRVRVKGEFPRVGVNQFIGTDVIDAARRCEPSSRLGDPLVIGVDVARHGDDRTVIFFRRGRDARTIPPIRLRVADLMQVAACVAEASRAHHADAVFVDMGMGAGVVDRLLQLNVPGVIGVEFGGASHGGGHVDGQRANYANKRAEMWGEMRAWLKHGAIPDDAELAGDLAGPQFGFNVRDQIQLERKEDMKKRGLASPDMADALALTFAYAAQARGTWFSHVGFAPGTTPGKVAVDYDPFADI